MVLSCRVASWLTLLSILLEQNGWTALHEAVRSGNTDTVRLLLERGAEINSRTGKQETGGSPLYMAKHVFLEDDHEIVDLLESRGGKVYAPEL